MHDMIKPVAQVLREAGEMMLSYQHPQVFDKGRHADFVTEADLAVQTFLLEKLTKLFPGAKFFAEEKEDNVLTDEFTFIIDPIDGTTNYFRRRDCSAISIGAVENGQPVLGLVLDPYHNRLYHAVKGGGAYCNEERLQVSQEPLSRALIGLGSSPYYEELFPLTAQTLGALLPRCADIRRSGSAALDLCDVARGVCDATFEWNLQPWDYCAGTLLIREAGGRCGCILGGDVTYDRSCAHMSAGAACFDELQALLQEVYRRHHA